MKIPHLALGDLVPSGRLEHPVTDGESVLRVYGWLSPVLGDQAVWHVEAVA